ncbi:integrase [Sphingomonas sp. Leaf24]|uniref:tyrosine-type recombinase/integrase n=1 Tax=unclassified Sphingomonas TaxID=196159 RepID=UPI0006F6ABA7|nr:MULTISPECIES: tyrosine-type recombinase/integrase [unclassified Sphingomonas]KQM21698.1 integrase [Sphingomonas sp. Leaf5]KQM93800.1 integrase [Sphingomonas sp. Leaf24]
MRVKMKGLKKVRKRLASGHVEIYYYAWAGGPRVEGKFGTPAFLASYNSAVATKVAARTDTLESLVDAFLDSSDFRALAAATQADYRRHLKIVTGEFGDFPIVALTDTRTRGEFMAWRDRRALKSKRQADYSFAVLARLLSWSVDRGLAPYNPCKRGGTTYRAKRTTAVWSEVDEAAFYAKAPPHMHMALRLALWTGQRQGDLLKLTWAQYDGAHIRLTQGKSIRRGDTGAATRIIIPIGKPLRDALDAARTALDALPEDERPSADTILLTARGTSWTRDGFKTSWGKACAKAGIRDVTFHDLRGTVVTRLALAGATPPEIATVTGHSLRDVHEILDRHYLNRDLRLAQSAIGKLEKG